MNAYWATPYHDNEIELASINVAEMAQFGIPPVHIVLVVHPFEQVACHQILLSRDSHPETRSASLAILAPNVAAVPGRDRPHQRQAQPDAASLFAGAARPVERFENSLALSFGYARAAVTYGEFNRVGRAPDGDVDRGRAAMAAGVLDQVA